MFVLYLLTYFAKESCSHYIYNSCNFLTLTTFLSPRQKLRFLKCLINFMLYELISDHNLKCQFPQLL